MPCKHSHSRCDEMAPQWYVSSYIIRTSIDRLYSLHCMNHGIHCEHENSIRPEYQAQHADFNCSGLALTFDLAYRIESWQQMNGFSLTKLNPPLSPHTLGWSRTDLLLIHHITSVSNDLLLNDLDNITPWTFKLPK